MYEFWNLFISDAQWFIGTLFFGGCLTVLGYAAIQMEKVGK